MKISRSVIRRGRNTLLDLRNSSNDTQPHSIIATKSNVQYVILDYKISTIGRLI